MKEFLKGNYRLATRVEETATEAESAPTLEFEKKALARLGGSICFVSKKGFLWTGEDGPAPPPADGGAG